MDLLAALLVAALTAGLAVAGVTVWSVVAIARRARRQRSLPDAKQQALARQAGSALVRLDDAIRDAAEELGFAIAQFGADDVREFRDALDAARADAREAFELQQRLDDGVPDTERQRREWTGRILALCERASASLAEHDRAFESRRRREVGAADELAPLRELIAAARARAALSGQPLPPGLEDIPPSAYALLDEAARTADRVAEAQAQGSIEPVGSALSAARRAVVRAEALLDEVDRVLRERADAAANLAGAVAAARAEADLARALRDRHEVPEQREALNAAIAEVTEAIDRSVLAQREPVEALEATSRARARLDTATAAAGSAEQRLRQAREALAGAMRQAEHHIAAASGFIAAHRGRVGPQARTRLAEAERQLALARDEADPVAALDAARRASGRAQDADALARYDALHS